ncbi:RICIN domain-containing protein [Bifidobacterium sp. SO4]|nr:RICIN domain-containing protein [Bifidobacterium sp. SO4]
MLDVNGGVLTDKANVQTYHNNHTSGQRWQVTHDDAGFITLTNVRSGKVLDVNGGVAQSGANVQQYTSNGGAGQRWVAVPTSDGKGFTLYSALNIGLRLDVHGAVNKDKTNVEIYRANSSKAQYWLLDTSPYVHGTIEAYWQRHAALGQPKANEQTVGDYLTQEFANGAVYVKKDGTLYAVEGAMYRTYAEAGGATGWLGYPVGNAQNSKDRVAQSFEHGSIISRNNGKIVTALTEEVSDYWVSQKGANGWLGWPKGSAEVTDERTAQEFDGGTVYVYPNGGTVPSIRSKYSQSGSWSLGSSANNITVKSGKYYLHEYSGGAIVAASETDSSTATVMNSFVYRYWSKQGGLGGWLGAPTGNSGTAASGSYQQFKGGVVYASKSGDVHAVHGGMFAEYTKQGGPTGKLGLPTSDETASVRKGAWQSFEHGTIYWRAGLGAFTVSGEFLERYQSQNAERGDRGYPRSEAYNDRGHTRQDFEHGSYWSDGMPAGVYTHNLHWAGQPNLYYCAPTSGYMVLATAGQWNAANGTGLTVNNVARYMNTQPWGTYDLDAVNGLNRWVGSNTFYAERAPSYETLRNAVMHSYETGYAPILFTYERRGGPHPNGHANATFGHAMVVDTYNSQNDETLIADPLASYGGAQKFWYNLGNFRRDYMVWAPSSDANDAASFVAAR